MMRTLVLALAVVYQVSAIPGNLDCDGTDWIAGQPFTDPNGDMGNIPVYTQGSAVLSPTSSDTCRINNLPTSLVACQRYTLEIESAEPMGHKMTVTRGLLLHHPSDDTEYQTDQCRHRYSQVKSTYVFQAPAAGSPAVIFYGLCGKFNGPMLVTGSVSRSVTGSTSNCASFTCNSGITDGVSGCFPPTAAPTPATAGDATNDRPQRASGAGSKSFASLVTFLTFFLAFASSII